MHTHTPLKSTSIHSHTRGVCFASTPPKERFLLLSYDCVCQVFYLLGFVYARPRGSLFVFVQAASVFLLRMEFTYLAVCRRRRRRRRLRPHLEANATWQQLKHPDCVPTAGRSIHHSYETPIRSLARQKPEFRFAKINSGRGSIQERRCIELGPSEDNVDVVDFPKTRHLSFFT